MLMAGFEPTSSGLRYSSSIYLYGEKYRSGILTVPLHFTIVQFRILFYTALASIVCKTFKIQLCFSCTNAPHFHGQLLKKRIYYTLSRLMLCKTKLENGLFRYVFSVVVLVV